MLNICGKTYYVQKMLGYGKGGYSFLAESDGEAVVLKQIHHEPCDYYAFGNKIEAEKRDHERLLAAGVRIPKLIAIDEKAERIVKEYIEGDTVFDMVARGENVDKYTEQVREMAALAKAASLNIDYFPTNFVVRDGILWYIDYECNEYMDEWSFENWGIKYWSRTPEFLEHEEKSRTKRKSDKEIALITVREDGYAYDHLTEDLRRDKDVILAALTASPDMLEELPDDMREDEEYILFALEAVAGKLPDAKDYSFPDDGSSAYYSEFENLEDDFCEVVGEIPDERLRNDPELLAKICELALKIDASYYNEGHNPYEWMHERLTFKLNETLDEMGIIKVPLPEEAKKAASQALIDESRYAGMTPEERLLNLAADRYDWHMGKCIARYGAEFWRDYLAPEGQYGRFCMVDFTKSLIAGWPGLYHDDPRWNDDKYKVDLDLAYEEISRRLAPKMKVERVAYEYYYSEFVGVTVNDNIFFKLVRECPMKVISLWVNKVDSEHEHGFWVAPDRLGVFCDMVEYIYCNYDRFYEMAKNRAAKLRRRWQQEE